MSKYHEPVLIRECIEGLNIKPNGVYADATFGGGGHSKEILKKLKEGKLFGFDQDEDAAKNAIEDERFVFVNQNFKHLQKMLRVNGVTHVDGILADLGVSSFQIDSVDRGFAFRLDGDLDMRMNKREVKTAADILNSYDAQHLQQILGNYGEVRNAKTLSLLIVEARGKEKFSSATRFIEIISPAIKGKRNRYLAQVFQALRIEVNDELNALKDFLDQSREVLNEGGRLAAISYHSLEDRIVKNFIRHGNAEGKSEKDFFGNEEKVFKAINKKTIEPTEEELNRNPRSCSARLRIAEKI